MKLQLEINFSKFRQLRTQVLDIKDNDLGSFKALIEKCIGSHLNIDNFGVLFKIVKEKLTEGERIELISILLKAFNKKDRRNLKSFYMTYDEDLDKMPNSKKILAGVLYKIFRIKELEETIATDNGKFNQIVSVKLKLLDKSEEYFNDYNGIGNSFLRQDQLLAEIENVIELYNHNQLDKMRSKIEWLSSDLVLKKII